MRSGGSILAVGGGSSNYLSGGGSGGVGDYVGQDWATKCAEIQGTIEEYTQACGRAVSQQNDETELIIGKMKKLTSANADLVELLAKFPVAGEKDDPDPALSKQSGYDSLLKSLNKWFELLGMKKIDDSEKKSELEGLKARCNGENEACSGRQGILSSRLNGWLNKFQSNETLLTNLIKLVGSIWNTYARNSGAV